MKALEMLKPAWGGAGIGIFLLIATVSCTSVRQINSQSATEGSADMSPDLVKQVDEASRNLALITEWKRLVAIRAIENVAKGTYDYDTLIVKITEEVAGPEKQAQDAFVSWSLAMDKLTEAPLADSPELIASMENGRQQKQIMYERMFQKTIYDVYHSSIVQALELRSSRKPSVNLLGP